MIIKANNSVVRKLDTYDLTLIACCVSVMTVCSWISIPVVVPFTMQTFAVFLTVGLLGGKRGTLAVLTYLLLGAIGLPVFSGFSGGLGYMLGATGGYIIGFLFSALIMWGLEKIIGNSVAALAVSMAAGLIVCYSFGTVWFATVYLRNDQSISLFSVLSMCVIPFVIPDCIKIALACMIVQRLRPLLMRL